MEKIKEIEAEMARTQKNKATSYHLGTCALSCISFRMIEIFTHGGASFHFSNYQER